MSTCTALPCACVQGSDVKKMRKMALEVLGESVTEKDLDRILPAK